MVVSWHYIIIFFLCVSYFLIFNLLRKSRPKFCFLLLSFLGSQFSFLYFSSSFLWCSKSLFVFSRLLVFQFFVSFLLFSFISSWLISGHYILGLVSWECSCLSWTARLFFSFMRFHFLVSGLLIFLMPLFLQEFLFHAAPKNETRAARL